MFQNYISNCLFDIGTQMSNKHLKPNITKTEFLISTPPPTFLGPSVFLTPLIGHGVHIVLLCGLPGVLAPKLWFSWSPFFLSLPPVLRPIQSINKSALPWEHVPNLTLLTPSPLSFWCSYLVLTDPPLLPFIFLPAIFFPYISQSDLLKMWMSEWMNEYLPLA